MTMLPPKIPSPQHFGGPRNPPRLPPTMTISQVHPAPVASYRSFWLFAFFP